ncbi:MAG: thioredoxin family protein [Arcobacteraceae bacterium]|nr:thioredoxin family protein [Arcobacteraceae bacterium]
MKIIISLILLLSWVFGTVLKDVESYKQALQIAKKQNKKVLMFMYSEYCPWCEKMEKTTLSDEKVINYINSKYIFLKMDSEMGEYPQILKPRFIPTTYVINPKTKETVQEIYGYKSAKDFINEFWDDE